MAEENKNKGLDRKQIIRMDCPTCTARGYVVSNGSETSCEACGGSGLREKEIPFKFETNGKLSKEELAQEFGVSTDQFKDEKHSTGD